MSKRIVTNRFGYTLTTGDLVTVRLPRGGSSDPQTIAKFELSGAYVKAYGPRVIFQSGGSASIDDVLPYMKRNPRSSGTRIIFNRLLGGWYIVHGPHQTPLGGRFDSKEEAEAHLRRPAGYSASYIRAPYQNPKRKMLARHAAAVSFKPRKRTARLKSAKFYHRAKTPMRKNPTFASKPKGIAYIKLRGVKSGKVYARMDARYTPQGVMKEMAKAIANRYGESVSAERKK